jgi:hypothetical protein
MDIKEKNRKVSGVLAVTEEYLFLYYTLPMKCFDDIINENWQKEAQYEITTRTTCGDPDKSAVS